MNQTAKILIILGVVFIVAGLGILLFSRFKIPFLGRLPGDIYIQRENFSFYFPLTSCILISGVVSLIFYFFLRK